MPKNMIIITGAAGFIGSCMVQQLNEKGYTSLVLVDDFSKQEKSVNWTSKQYTEKVERKVFFDWFKHHHENVKAVIHLGARTDTTEFRKEIFDELNVAFSEKMWEACTLYHIPLIYASSAATYGMGELGYTDDHDLISNLKPLNPYGISKHEFDKWALAQTQTPPFWAGLKFFNVYGPNEYHKGRMASVIFHAYNQIKQNGQVKLFRSHRPDYQDGMQLRDFIYVKDVTAVIMFLLEKQPDAGIYNLGTGKARAFLDLAKAVFKALEIKEHIDFVDTPEDIRDKYQYFTEADMHKLRQAGYDAPFISLEEGVTDYVCHYLNPGKVW